MKSLVFDAGPIISLTMNNLLWLLDPLKKKFNGRFYISSYVKKELVDKPLSTKRFEFEALQVIRYIKNQTLNVGEEKRIEVKTKYLLDLANSCFIAKDNSVKIVHYGEIESLALALNLKSNALVIDERTTRLLIENPEKLASILQRKLHTKITINKKSLKQFKKEVSDIKVIRSTELVIAAYEMGLLDRYLPDVKKAKERLLDAVLWGVKLDGCSISKKEIDELIKIEK